MVDDSSSFSNNKRHHHGITAIIKDHLCVSQLPDFTRNLTI